MTAGLVLASSAASPAYALATLPATDHIYAYDCTDGASDFQLLELAADGTATAIGTGMGTTTGDCPGQPAWDWITKKGYFAFDGKLYSTDVSTGVTTEVASLSGAGVDSYLTGYPALAIAPDGTAWVGSNGRQGKIDLATGVVTQFVSTNADNGFYYIYATAYNAVDSTLYAIQADDVTDDSPPYPNQLSVMSQTTGDITLGAGVTLPDYQGPAVESLYAMAFDSSGQGWLLRTDSPETQLVSLNPTTGATVDQGGVMEGADNIVSEAIFISSPTPALPDTGAESSLNVGAIAALGAALLAAGSIAFVIARRRTA
ncbi:MAG: LPXTG cell wall anchor domain-containing protein [Actinobacteria bacterium]|nr:LPXTG cell wall anchor domain-containing protein [Actinomycetota bacterium]